MPASSAVAVASTSAGAACAHERIVIAGSSGDEKAAASPVVSRLTATRASTNSFTRS